MTIEIAGRPIGPGHPPLVIAEMSDNHNQSRERALEIVDAAAHFGANAMKKSDQSGQLIHQKIINQVTLAKTP